MSIHTIYDVSALLPLIAAGDQSAFARLFKCQKDRIYSIAFKLTKSAELSEEIVQDVFIKIWQKRSDLEEIRDFNAYLFIVTRNKVYKVLKRIAKSYKVVLLSEEDVLLSKEDATGRLMDKEFSHLLQSAIDRLPSQQKQVYYLMKDQGLKREAVAEKLSIQPETVKYHLAQAMKNIRSYCSPHVGVLIGVLLHLPC